MSNAIRLGLLFLFLSTAYAVQIQLDNDIDPYDDDLIDEFIEDDLDEGSFDLGNISDDSKHLASKMLELYTDVVSSKRKINEVFKTTKLKSAGQTYDIWKIKKKYDNKTDNYDLVLSSNEMDIYMTIYSLVQSPRQIIETIPEPTTARVNTTPKPVQTTNKAKVETTPKPVQKTTARLETTPKPVQTTTARLEATPKPVQKTTSKINTTPKTTETTTSRVNTTPKPVQTTTKARLEATPKTTETTTSRVNTSPKPVQTTTSRVNTTPKPVQTTVAKVETTPKTTQITTARLETTPKPVQTTTSRVNTPVQTTTARVNNTPQTTTARVNTTPQTTTSRVNTTPKPTQLTVARVETTPKPDNTMEDRRFRQILGQWFLLGLPENIYYSKYNFRACDIITLYSHGQNYYLKTAHNIGNQTFTMHDQSIDKLDKNNALFSIEGNTYHYKIIVIEGSTYKLKLFHLTNTQNTKESYIYGEKLINETLLEKIFMKHYRTNNIIPIEQYCFRD